MPVAYQGKHDDPKALQAGTAVDHAASSRSTGTLSKKATISQVTIGRVMIRWVRVSAV